MPSNTPENIFPPNVFPPQNGPLDIAQGKLNTLPGLTDSPLGEGVIQTSKLTDEPIAVGEHPPELQQYLDQGYNLEEAKQLLGSQNYGPNAEETAARILKTTDGPMNIEQDDGDPNALGNILNTAGAGVSLEQAAYGLGRSIGSEKGAAKTLGIVGNAGKLVMGTARGVASGLGAMKKSQYVQDYYDKKSQEADRSNYVAAAQTANTNTTGGRSFGEDGGIQGKTLPLKAFLKNGGFKKPGYKKLM